MAKTATDDVWAENRLLEAQSRSQDAKIGDLQARVSRLERFARLVKAGKDPAMAEAASFALQEWS